MLKYLGKGLWTEGQPHQSRKYSPWVWNEFRKSIRKGKLELSGNSFGLRLTKATQYFEEVWQFFIKKMLQK